MSTTSSLSARTSSPRRGSKPKLGKMRLSASFSGSKPSVGFLPRQPEKKEREPRKRNLSSTRFFYDSDGRKQTFKINLSFKQFQKYQHLAKHSPSKLVSEVSKDEDRYKRQEVLKKLANMAAARSAACSDSDEDDRESLFSQAESEDDETPVDKEVPPNSTGTAGLLKTALKNAATRSLDPNKLQSMKWRAEETENEMNRPSTEPSGQNNEENACRNPLFKIEKPADERNNLETYAPENKNVNDAATDKYDEQQQQSSNSRELLAASETTRDSVKRQKQTLRRSFSKNNLKQNAVEVEDLEQQSEKPSYDSSRIMTSHRYTLANHSLQPPVSNQPGMTILSRKLGYKTVQHTYPIYSEKLPELYLPTYKSESEARRANQDGLLFDYYQLPVSERGTILARTPVFRPSASLPSLRLIATSTQRPQPVRKKKKKRGQQEKPQPLFTEIKRYQFTKELSDTPVRVYISYYDIISNDNCDDDDNLKYKRYKHKRTQKH